MAWPPLRREREREEGEALVTPCFAAEDTRERGLLEKQRGRPPRRLAGMHKSMRGRSGGTLGFLKVEPLAKAAKVFFIYITLSQS